MSGKIDRPWDMHKPYYQEHAFVDVGSPERQNIPKLRKVPQTVQGFS